MGWPFQQQTREQREGSFQVRFGAGIRPAESVPRTMIGSGGTFANPEFVLWGKWLQADVSGK